MPLLRGTNGTMTVYFSTFWRPLRVVACDAIIYTLQGATERANSNMICDNLQGVPKSANYRVMCDNSQGASKRADSL